MSSSLRRGALAAALALSLAPLAACAAGNHAETLRVRPDNAATSVGDIEVQNAVVLTQATSDGDSSVTAKIFNSGDEEQTLKSVKVGSLDAELSGRITVPAHGSVLLGGDGNPSAVFKGGSESKNDGDFKDVVFDFSKTGEVSLPSLALPAAGYYSSFGPSGKASPTETAGSGESPTGSATASPTETETITESPAG
ncbi:DUF461 domain-containing protein [Streptomyces sp. ME01-24h]|nr:DUF461 domain-containing protein [Streptomyces sp. ME19-03-3]MDX3214240.1 DUF461 domain-containing protein [Streptomyces sp. ME02-6991-2B]MDX3352973.1 DUF461 domain-containing protein [Streptomyces sp. ME01-24h]